MKPLRGSELVGVRGGVFDPSKSDGCTLGPDGWWRQACVDHDRAYYYGGSAADRKRADDKLYADMIDQGAPRAVAGIYYYVVRAMGAMPGTSRRWGFGAT